MANAIVGQAQRSDLSYREDDPYEQAENSLRAALALGAIIGEATTGGNACNWSAVVIEDLQQAQALALNCARDAAQRMRCELWNAHAKAGDYGPEAKAHAEAEVQP